MPADHALEMRQAIVKRMRETGSAVQVICDARIYGEQPPAEPLKPFVRYGVPVTLPYEASGWDGSEHSIVVHGFTGGSKDTDDINALAKAISATLENSELNLGSLGLVGIDWRGTEILRDGEGYHAVVRFSATTVV